MCRNIEEYGPHIGVGKQAVLCITGPIAMSKAMYPILRTCPHLLLKNKEYKFGYDMMGGYIKKQQQLGAGKHYSKLKEPVIF